MTGNLMQDGGGIDYAYAGGLPVSAGFMNNGISDCPSPCRGQTSYDNAGRVTRMADPQGYLTLIEYDLQDNVIKQTDSSGKVILSEYDQRNRLVRKVDRLGSRQVSRVDR